MKSCHRRLIVGAIALTSLCGTAVPCGTPPQPPPPPPSPPIVYCSPVRWIVDPTNPNFQCIIVRYFRLDGRPLYQSNPMPLLPTQQCACALPPLSSAAALNGAQIAGISFGSAPDCNGLPPNVPPYGPWTRNTLPSITGQVGNFFNAYANAAQGTVQPPDASSFFDVFSFPGPGTIPSGVVWDIYQYIRVPNGFPVNTLCVPGQAWMIGLFLIDGGNVLAEPPSQGLPPIPISQFVANPGASAFYKFCWLPNTLPGPCPCPVPPPCVGDLNGDGFRNTLDLTIFLGNFGAPCP